MTRYGANEKLDGCKNVISRIHVTGGTNGILVKALIKYKPFTPSFIGRAEDQAYILSVLSGTDSFLRYYHEDGLIMRHDKEAFAGDSIAAAKDGTYVADIMRILYYTFYAKALDGRIGKTKEETSPFTGSYISRYPVTLSYMRLFFKLLEMYAEGQIERADKMMSLGILRIQPLINKLIGNNFLKDVYEEEKRLWALYYHEIETWNLALSKGDKKAQDKCEKLRKVFSQCLVT